MGAREVCTMRGVKEMTGGWTYRVAHGAHGGAVEEGLGGAAGPGAGGDPPAAAARGRVLGGACVGAAPVVALVLAHVSAAVAREDALQHAALLRRQVRRSGFRLFCKSTRGCWGQASVCGGHMPALCSACSACQTVPMSSIGMCVAFGQRGPAALTRTPMVEILSVRVGSSLLLAPPLPALVLPLLELTLAVLGSWGSTCNGYKTRSDWL